MSEFPAMLRLRGRRAVVLGGGGVAARRAASLVEAGAAVTVIAPEVDPRIADLGVEVMRRGYRKGDLAGARLVVLATDVPGVNDAAAEEAERTGALVNRADRPEAGDLTVPAHKRIGPVTVSVHTGGVSARAAAVIRDQMLEALDPDWPRLLEAVRPFREPLQQRVSDAQRRKAALHKLTDPEAMRTLKEHGEAALAERCRAIVETAASGTEPTNPGEADAEETG
jgi:precorrin-2 dehydrogenase/sirohydrochlorin ferrochelatase